MLKHGLISSPAVYEPLFSLDLTWPDSPEMLARLEESIAVKRRVVEEDPFEKGLASRSTWDIP